MVQEPEEVKRSRWNMGKGGQQQLLLRKVILSCGRGQRSNRTVGQGGQVLAVDVHPAIHPAHDPTLMVGKALQDHQSNH